jgi:stalled ribosome alternative rescue factor ArfA
MKRNKSSAKSLVFVPLFRSRQEKPRKGKGSYSRQPRHPSNDAGLFGFWGI